MKEIVDIIRAYRLSKDSGKRVALATVVHVEGSSYRRPGARMLVTEDGELTGAISGGCLEGDALRKALLAITEQRNKLVTYDTSDEDDAKFGVQLGCSGVVHILFEPDLPGKSGPMDILEAIVTTRGEAVVATLFSLNGSDQPGTGLLQKDGLKINLLPDIWSDIIAADTEKALALRTSIIKSYSAAQHTFYALMAFIAAPVTVIIAGAGNDAIPLVKICTLLGWETTVVDGRASYASKARFTDANRIFVAKPAELMRHITVDAQTVFVLMTHNYNYDIGLLQQLLNEPCQYIGILGPKKKLHRMFNELETSGFAVPEALKQNIFSPAGLDIGAETPEEIALSIASEIKAVLSERSGGNLRLINQPIHQRGEIQYQHE